MKQIEAKAALGPRENSGVGTQPLDKVIFAVVLLVGAVWIAWLNVAMFSGRAGGKVQIIQHGDVVAEYSLNDEIREQRFDNGTGGYNVLDIGGGNARIVEANCPDRICMQNVIDRPNQTIVCLPNELIVKIIGKTDEDTFVH